jgi:hypothetical protein
VSHYQQPPPVSLGMSWDEVVRHALQEFDKTPTPAILAFEVVVLLATLVAIRAIRRRRPRVLAHYATLAAGVVIFELFTAPMWNNFRLGVWAYVYKDVSWILTLGWTTMILTTIVLVDAWRPGWSEGRRFVVYLVVLSVLVAVAERVVVALGIRSYAPEVEEVLRDSYLPLLGISIHQLYYVPVFLTLVISFYKYWVPSLDGGADAVPAGPARWLARSVVALLSVFLFEIMVEPMVENSGFPAWSYVYRDISVLLTLVWAAVIWVSTLVVDAVGGPRHWSRGQRFAGYLGVVTLIYTPIEAWLIHHGYRVYGPSAQANFSGFTVTVLDVPVEVAMAVPLYAALIIGTMRYWTRTIEAGGHVRPQPAGGAPPEREAEPPAPAALPAGV